MRRAMAVCLLVAGVLSGCGGRIGGGGAEAPQPVLTQSASILTTGMARRGAQTQGPRAELRVTRALLDATPGEVLEVRNEKLGLRDFLRLIATRRDAYPGGIEVWRSSDEAQLVLRDGVLVGTRGFGGDLRSAEAGPVLRFLRGGDGAGGGSRLLVIDRLDGTAQRVRFSCVTELMGQERLRIVDRQIEARQVRETCQQGDTRFTNHYWVDRSTGRLRRSRQWAGPHIGYLHMVRLTP